MLSLPASFQHFRLRVRFRFQPLLSKCFRFHKKLTASTASSFRFLFHIPVIDMILKRAKCDLNGVKITIFAAKLQKSPNSGGLYPSVTRLSCSGLFRTGGKLTIFVQKNIYFGFNPLSLSKTLVALLVAFTPAHRFFKRLYGPHTKRANKRCRAYISLFSKMNTKL